MDAVKKEVIFDETGTYKYSLLCKWSEVNERKLTFILSFPENTYEYSDDTAVSKCIELAQKWGFGVLEIVYLFSYQTDHVSFLRMLSKEEAVGTRTGEYIQKAVEDAELVVVAWGDHGSIYNRQEEVERFLKHKPVYCFGKTKQQFPRHILSVVHRTELQKYEVPANREESEEVSSFIEDIDQSFGGEDYSPIKELTEEEPLMFIEDIASMYR